MLGRFPLNPVLPAQDGNRARRFYRDVLGLVLVSGPSDDPMMFTAGDGTRIVVTEIPDRTPPGYPMVSFLVEDIDQLVAALAERGAHFHDPGADRGSFAGTAGKAEGAVTDYGPVKTAWLVDSEGNLLALNELIPLRSGTTS